MTSGNDDEPPGNVGIEERAFEKPQTIADKIRIAAESQRDDEPTGVETPSGKRDSDEPLLLTMDPVELHQTLMEIIGNELFVFGIEETCIDYGIGLSRKEDGKPFQGRGYNEDSENIRMGVTPKDYGYNFIMSDTSSTLALRLRKEDNTYSLTIAYDPSVLDKDKISKILKNKIPEQDSTQLRLFLRTINHIVNSADESDAYVQAERSKLSSSLINNTPIAFKIVLDAVAETYEK